MDRFRFVPFSTAPARSRRTLLGTALATAGAASSVAGAGSKKKKNKKKCKAPTTKCGKKACCQPDEVCENGQCQTTTTTPPPLTLIVCPGPRDASQSGTARVAQTFVANGSGAIVSASFDVAGIAVNTPLGVEIRTTQNGVPTSVVLGTAIVTGLPATPSGTPITATATFGPKVPVTQGVTYALVISDIARKGLLFSKRNEGVCPTELFDDPQANDQFIPIGDSLVYSIIP